jgi:hypothetical protein
MRPNSEEVLRGVQGALLTYVLPELRSQFALSELTLASALLGMVAAELDGAAQRLVDANAELRALLGRAAGAVEGDLAGELRALAAERDGSVRLADLSAANERLREALARLAVHAEAAGPPELRGEVIAHLRRDTARDARSLLGPRTDG